MKRKKDTKESSALIFLGGLIMAIQEIATKIRFLVKKYYLRILITAVVLLLLIATVDIVGEKLQLLAAKKYENGLEKVYYSHYVSEGESLYSICEEANPSQWMSTYEYMTSIASKNQFPHGNWNKLQVGDEIILYYYKSKGGN